MEYCCWMSSFWNCLGLVFRGCNYDRAWILHSKVPTLQRVIGANCEILGLQPGSPVRWAPHWQKTGLPHLLCAKILMKFRKHSTNLLRIQTIWSSWKSTWITINHCWSTSSHAARDQYVCVGGTAWKQYEESLAIVIMAIGIKYSTVVP